MGKLDNYSWRPLLWATLLAITLVGWMGALNFMPIRPPLAGGFGVRLTLDLWFPFVALAEQRLNAVVDGQGFKFSAQGFGGVHIGGVS